MEAETRFYYSPLGSCRALVAVTCSLVLLFGGCKCSDEPAEDEVPGEEISEVTYGAAGEVMRVPVEPGRPPRAAPDARVVLLMDLDSSGTFDEAEEHVAELDEDGRFEVFTERIEYEGGAPRVRAQLVAILDGHATAYRRVDLEADTRPWIDATLFEYEGMELGERTSLADGSLTITGLPEGIQKAWGRVLHPVLDAEGVSGGGQAVSGVSLSFGVVGAVRLVGAQGEAVRQLEEPVTLRMELVEETWGALSAIAPGRGIDPSDDFIDLGDDFIDPSDDFIDPSDDFYDVAASVPLFAFSESDGAWSFQAVGRLETAGGAALTYGQLQDVWSGEFDGRLFVRGDVEHFSQWGYGWPVGETCIEGVLEEVTGDDDTKQPAAGVTVTGRGVGSDERSGPVVTDSEGRFCLHARPSAGVGGGANVLRLHARLEDGDVRLGEVKVEMPEDGPVECGEEGCQDAGVFLLERPDGEEEARVEPCGIPVRVLLPGEGGLWESLRPETAAGASVKAHVPSSRMHAVKELCGAGGDVDDCLVSEADEEGEAVVTVPRGEERVEITGRLLHEAGDGGAQFYDYRGRVVLSEPVCVEGEEEEQVELELRLRRGDVERVDVWVDIEDEGGEVPAPIIGWNSVIPYEAGEEPGELSAERVTIYSGEGDEVLWEVVARDDVEGGAEPGMASPLEVRDYGDDDPVLRQPVPPGMDALTTPGMHPDAYVVVQVRGERLGVLWEGRGAEDLHAGVEVDPEEANSLKYVSGDNQTGNRGEPLTEPLRVLVEDAHGNPVEGHEVTFSLGMNPPGDDASLNPMTTHSSADGLASTQLTLGNAGGAYHVEASGAGIDGLVKFEATACDLGTGWHPDYQAECYDEVEVLCDSTGLPAENSSVEYDERVTVTWSEEDGWSVPEPCVWSCDPGYHEHEQGDAIECVECIVDGHCTPNLLCLNNTCVECIVHDDCPNEGLCYSNECIDNPCFPNPCIHGNPVVRLDIEEGTGASLEDSSGNGNDATLEGGAWTSEGKYGYALELGGAQNGFSWSYTKPQNNFTLEAWVKAESSHDIDNESTSGTTGTTGQAYLFRPGNEGSSNAGAGVSVGTNGISVYENGDDYMPALAVHEEELGTGWNHIVVTYENKIPRIYLNGSPVRTGLTSPRNNVLAPNRIGGSDYGSFAGAVDRVRVYDYTLSDEQVLQAYAKQEDCYLSASLDEYTCACDHGWDWDSSNLACIPKVYTCPAKPEEGAEWNTVSEYIQEWDHDHGDWMPPATSTHYNEEPDEQSCRYVCSPGYRFNGETCEPRTACLTGSKFENVSPLDLLHAMDICDFFDEGEEGSFGIVHGSVELGRANWSADSNEPDHRQYGIMTQFGTDSSNVPKFGDNMAVLSSGRARDASDPDATATVSYEYEHGEPPNDFVAPHGGALPLTYPSCPRGTGANDSVMLRVKLKVPEFAHAFSFDFRFFSQEYGDYTCSIYNDFFIAMLDSDWIPENGGSGIPEDKNISFDSNENYIGVNSHEFFTVCEPKFCQNSGAVYDCPDGTSPLSGTGYPASNAGATQWLTTTSPVVPGETITLRFIIWDTTDPNYDSLVLLDNFRWHGEGTAKDGPETRPSDVAAPED